MIACFAVLALCVAGGAGLAVAAGFGHVTGRALLAPIALAGLGLAALWIAYTLLDAHFADLDRLRADILAVDPTSPILPQRWADAGQDASEAARVAVTAADMIGRIGDWMGEPDRRLAAVLAAIEDGFLVITATGLVSVANGAARSLLGAEPIAVGTSIFAALKRDVLVAALDRARDAGHPITARLKLVDGTGVDARLSPLGPPGGAVLSFSVEAIGHHGTIDYDLALHDEPPPPVAVTGATRLDELPVVVLDTETTGLDVTRDRIVSVGAVRMHGRLAFPHVTVDRLVNPEVPIPARSSAVHGITDAMVAEAPAFAALHPALSDFLGGCVLVGHNIGFDCALLRAECDRAGLPWADPPSLDTGHVVAALYPDMTDIDLDSIAERLGVEARGRHTALGDCLATAEIFSKLIALMADRDITTFEAARALAGKPKRLIGAQRAAGW